MGCSLAFYLARQGRSVIVIDRGRIGQGATAACAVGIRAQFSTEVNIRMGMEAKRVLSRFVDETGQSADFRQVGYLFLLTTDDERARFAEAVRLQRRLGVEDVVELSPSDARAIVPGLETDDLAGATFCPSDGLAGPNEVTYGFANAARRRGAVILEDTPLAAFLGPGAARTVDWSFLERITAVAQRRWPPLLDARVKTAWAGLYEMTPDYQPLIGPLQSGLWVAAGFSGHGFMMAPAVGRWLATWIV